MSADLEDEGKGAAKFFLQEIRGINSQSFENDGDRMKALLEVYALMARLESPWETLVRLCMIQPALGAALKICKDLQLFEKWSKKGAVAMTSEQLAGVVGGSCESGLLYRLLRLLASNHLIEETSMGSFKQTHFSSAITTPVFDGLIHSFNDVNLPLFAKMADFFAETGYKNPQDSEQTVFQYAHGWNGNLWSYYEAHPEKQQQFNVIQQTISAQQPAWTDIFPVHTLLEVDPGLPLLVDVGGSTGHDLLKFYKAHPETASLLYLEDLESVIQSAELPESINKIAYDFFSPQPVMGARAYFMHSILHDWSDESARTILTMQRNAMKPGFSKLLIHDHVVPESLAHPQATAFDFQMMAMVAGQERSEGHWRALLESVGLRVVRIWTLESAVHSIIEAEATI
ncbi:Putative O-methyltransferase domain, S-adenosyl-L-methionine-dependent methyltransferase superfamily [Colletotrichum destructivum]|uniref:O-methyltransferase domain, S-adenosyl-L-methionine-dependent methyltransferase superfamily n=1 Tax=Colletotrichum destructivum TaxID=34406 RepID=A0AAX4IM60_9PEZI|nr:Putative O-methyltransferase domain, S-adenosyl-L-methionine-dependent methyltransferase superfamily [Colletotrichum destructivum]